LKPSENGNWVRSVVRDFFSSVGQAFLACAGLQAGLVKNFPSLTPE